MLSISHQEYKLCWLGIIFHSDDLLLLFIFLFLQAWECSVIGLTFSTFNLPFISAKVRPNSAVLLYFLCDLTLSLHILDFSFCDLSTDSCYLFILSYFLMIFFAPFSHFMVYCECKSILRHFSSGSDIIFHYQC